MRGRFAAPENVPAVAPITTAAVTNQIHGIGGIKPTFASPSLVMPPRILSPSEIRAVWEATSTGTGEDAVYKRALKLILVSGQGPRAVAGMHREEINGKCWLVPLIRSWDRLPYQVFLTPSALDLIGYTKGYIFTSRDGKQPITSSNIARFLSSKTVAYYGLDKWTPKDLRATVMHHMITLGISINVCAAIFGTTITGSFGGGARVHEYNAAVIAAMQKWEAELLRIVGYDQTSLGISASPVFGL